MSSGAVAPGGELGTAEPGRGRRGALIALAAGLAALVFLLPPIAGLPPAGQRAAALFALAVMLWLSEALPPAVTALLVVIAQPLLDVQPLKSAFAAFVSPVFFFVLAMYLLAAAITGSGLDRRLASWLLERAGADSRRVVWALMLGTGLLSTIMSDVPACAIFMSVALGILGRAGAVPGSSRLGRALMVGIPIASMVGGVATPAGSSINVLGLHFIEQYGHVRVSFLQWMALGVPMLLLLLPVSCWAVLLFHAPEPGPLEQPAELREQRARLGPLAAAERKALGLLAVMMALWIAGSWLPALDVVLVALAGAVAMFLPGVDLLEWRSAQRSVGWDTLLMIGGVTSIGAASVETGLARWLVELVLSGMRDSSEAALLLALGAFTVVVHLALPIAPVVNAVVIPPVALFALSTGRDPAALALPVAFTASCAFLLPLDAVALVTYGKGYYRMFDMLGPGTLVSVVWVAWMTLLMLIVGPLLGLGG